MGAKRQFVDRIVNADPPNICRIELADVGPSVGRCHQVAPSRLDFPDCLNRDVVGSPERVREAARLAARPARDVTAAALDLVQRRVGAERREPRMVARVRTDLGAWMLCQLA